MIEIVVPLWGSPIMQEVIIIDSRKAGVSHKVRGGSLKRKERASTPRGPWLCWLQK